MRVTKNVIDEFEPWYRNPWVWLLIAIPSMTVAGCLVTIYLALSNPHQLVSDTVRSDGAELTAAE